MVPDKTCLASTLWWASRAASKSHREAAQAAALPASAAPRLSPRARRAGVHRFCPRDIFSGALQSLLWHAFVLGGLLVGHADMTRSPWLPMSRGEQASARDATVVTLSLVEAEPLNPAAARRPPATEALLSDVEPQTTSSAARSMPMPLTDASFVKPRQMPPPPTPLPTLSEAQLPPAPRQPMQHRFTDAATSAANAVPNDLPSAMRPSAAALQPPRTRPTEASQPEQTADASTVTQPPAPADSSDAQKPATAASAGLAGVSNAPQVLDLPHPKYPPLSRRLGEEGLVVLSTWVRADGTPTDIRVVRAPDYPRLVAAARDALARARFTPAQRDGREVGQRVTIPFRFVLR